MQLQNIHLRADAAQEIPLLGRARDPAVENFPREAATDDIDPAIGHHEHHDRRGDADRHALKETEDGDHTQDQQDYSIVDPGELAIGFDGPLDQQFEAQIEQHAADHKSGRQGEQTGAGEQHAGAHQRGHQAGQTAVNAHFQVEIRQRELLKVHDARKPAGQQVGHTGRPQLLIQFDILAGCAFQAGGVEQGADGADQNDHHDGGRLAQNHLPVDLAEFGGGQWL